MPSVLKITQELADSHIVYEIGEAETAIGRKPMRYRFNPGAIGAFGVEFEGRHLSMGLVHLDGTVQFCTDENMHHRFDDRFVDAVAACCERAFGHNVMPGRQIAGIGIGIPGVVDRNKRIIEFAPLIGIEKPLDANIILEKMTRETGLPVSIDNDVNCAAIGEWMVRGSKHGDLIYLSLGTGIGAGVVLEGQLRRGRRNLCGEFGYWVGEVAAQGNRSQLGWLESRLNVGALEKRFNWSLGSPAPVGMLEEVVNQLSPWVANIATFLDIETITLGGLLTDLLGESLVHALKSEVNRMSVCEVSIDLHQAHQPGIIGAALMMVEDRLDALL